ncbi:hypothetical protein BDV24DRAFT_139121 [Aspergillus arachidicola]|uniref:Uncharacterized protein n=1 Tax=Aspergillus arachidicola TaxID=656916 RepID=A0A5N6Y0C1_9EURO|nr:hypothetical protein BDV24DRAFT_139121 [Aspergillus arachidicola]
MGSSSYCWGKIWAGIPKQGGASWSFLRWPIYRYEFVCCRDYEQLPVYIGSVQWEV